MYVLQKLKKKWPRSQAVWGCGLCHLTGDPPLPLSPPVSSRCGSRINTYASEVNGIIPLELSRKIRRGIFENALNTSHVSPCRRLFKMWVEKKCQTSKPTKEGVFWAQMKKSAKLGNHVCAISGGPGQARFTSKWFTCGSPWLFTWLFSSRQSKECTAYKLE